MTLYPGDLAPEFSLNSSDGEIINLSDYRGQNVVVLFFPIAFTRVCTAELCSVRDEKSEYDAFNASVLGISVDSEKVLEKFRSEQQFNFPLLSDDRKEVCSAYGAYLSEHGISKRAAFVIDKHRVIRHAEVLENSREMPDFVALKKILTELIN